MSERQWSLVALHGHLQGAIDLELWTIPYYLSVLYSIKDPSSESYRLIQSVVYQEMLHTQLACNIANAYGLQPKFTVPDYLGDKVPHIDFKLDDPNPTQLFSPFSPALGPLDEKRINTMCLIEYPEWDTERSPDLRSSTDEYGSIGEFYRALQFGLAEFRDHCRGGINQVDEFRSFYRNMPAQTVTHDGDEGYRQSLALVSVILDQGEGQTQGVTDIGVQNQNTADGYQESWPHFKKFNEIRESGNFPATYDGVSNPNPGSTGFAMQETLSQDFSEFLSALEKLFSGQGSSGFGATMAKLGGDVLNCWQNQAVPRFARQAEK